MLLPQEQVPPENTLQTSLGEGLFAAKTFDDTIEPEINAMVSSIAIILIDTILKLKWLLGTCLDNDLVLFWTYLVISMII